MTWPQIVILVWLLFGTITSIKREVENRHQTSGMATFGVFIVLAIQAGIAAVLYAGGFW